MRCYKKSGVIKIKGCAKTTQIARNKNSGAYFEKIFEHRATLCGLLALKNELSFRYQAGGKMMPMRTDLDYRVCAKSGQVAFLDMKGFDADYFTYSQITSHQLRRARIYEQYNVPAGFVVWFKPSQRVVYFGGIQVACAGPKSRFTEANGLSLGSLMTFDLRPIFSKL